MERKIRFIEIEMKKEGINLDEPSKLPPAPPMGDMIHLEVI